MGKIAALVMVLEKDRKTESPIERAPQKKKHHKKKQTNNPSRDLPGSAHQAVRHSQHFFPKVQPFQAVSGRLHELRAIPEDEPAAAASSLSQVFRAPHDEQSKKLTGLPNLNELKQITSTWDQVAQGRSEMASEMASQ